MQQYNGPNIYKYKSIQGTCNFLKELGLKLLSQLQIDFNCEIFSICAQIYCGCIGKYTRLYILFSFYNACYIISCKCQCGKISMEIQYTILQL